MNWNAHVQKLQTLAGIGGDIFGADKAVGAAGGGVKAPARPGGIAETFDPNYQVMILHFQISLLPREIISFPRFST